MSSLPRIARPITADAEYRSGNRKWSVIVETIDAAGRKSVQGSINIIAPSEAEASRKATSHWKSKGFISARVYSIMDLG